MDFLIRVISHSLTVDSVPLLVVVLLILFIFYKKVLMQPLQVMNEIPDIKNDVNVLKESIPELNVCKDFDKFFELLLAIKDKLNDLLTNCSDMSKITTNFVEYQQILEIVQRSVDEIRMTLTKLSNCSTEVKNSLKEELKQIYVLLNKNAQILQQMMQVNKESDDRLSSLYGDLLQKLEEYKELINSKSDDFV